MSAALEALKAHYRRIYLLGEAAGVLGWDQQTMMPPGAAAGRGEVMAELSALTHAMTLDPRVGEWLDEAEAALDPSAPDHAFEAANLREIRRERAAAMALSEELVAARARAASACEQVWRDARAKSDFALLRPSFETVLTLEREAAAALGDALELDPYDALLDGFEPGARLERVTELFDDLADFVPALREAALDADYATPVPRGPFPIERQEKLARELMSALGFDFSRGRLDTSLHPFCGGADDDVRITTRYDENDFASSIMGVLHETGHALYELGLPQAWRDQPVGRAGGMVLHESQSLLVEMQVCRSPEFFAFAAPIFAETFDADPSDPLWAPETFAASAIRVSTGFIRVDADELSYPLHVILRTRLEAAMIRGALEIADLPTAWSEGFEDLFGVRPPDDARGCLQDIHWPSGAFGYFPTYTLGAVAAAQIYAAARKALPALAQDVRTGRFEPLVDWLREAVHAQASLGTTDEILTRATGAPLSAAAYKQHLAQRYGA